MLRLGLITAKRVERAVVENANGMRLLKTGQEKKQTGLSVRIAKSR